MNKFSSKIHFTFIFSRSVNLGTWTFKSVYYNCHNTWNCVCHLFSVFLWAQKLMVLEHTGESLQLGGGHTYSAGAFWGSTNLLILLPVVRGWNYPFKCVEFCQILLMFQSRKVVSLVVIITRVIITRVTMSRKTRERTPYPAFLRDPAKRSSKTTKWLHYLYIYSTLLSCCREIFL